MAYTNSLGQVRVFVRDGNMIGLGVPYVYVPPTILDETAFTPMVSYSLRKLKTNYSGKAIRVRRSYDNAESDIGFASNGVLDVASIKSFVDAGVALGNQDVANWDSLSYTGNSIVTDSLIFHVNTANTSSYSGSGTTLNSLVGSFPGTMNGVTFEQSNGGTLGFDGSSSRISYGSTIFPSAPTNFSLSVWVYINDLPTSHREILSWWTSVNNGGSLFFGITSGGGIRFGEQTIYGLTDEHVGRWVEISIVKDGTLLSAYINGAILNSATANVSFNLQSNLTIGMHPGYGEYFSGRLAQVKIYNKALSSSEIYQNYRATSGTFTEDHDALLFINAAGLTNSVHKSAVHTLVRDLKWNKLWSKLKVVYPFVGGSANSHKYNLKDPRDLNSAFRLSFYGGWTHSSTGAYPNGTNGWANTNYNPSTNALSSSDLHLLYYSRTNNDNGGIEIGAQSSSSLGLYLQLKAGGYTYFGTNNTYNQPYGGGFVRLTSTTSAGNFVYIKYSTRQDPFYRDGQYVGQLNIANGAANDPVVNKELYIGAFNNGTTASNFSSRETSFISVGQSIDDIEAYKYNYIIQKFQTILGRQIGASYSTPNIHPDGDVNEFIQNALITDTTQTNELTKLVSSMKYEGIWNTTTGLYPFIGATAHSHRFNLKSYKYILSFSGGWTHTSTGAKPNGTNAFATTRLYPSTTFTLNNGHFGIYSRTDSDGGYDIASFGLNSTNFMGMIAKSNYRLIPLINNFHYSSIDPKESTGFSFGMRGAIGGTFSETSAMYLMKNDTIDYLDQNVEGFTNYTTLPTNDIVLSGAFYSNNGNYGGYASREHSFTTIGTKAMTQLQAQKYSRIVQRYQSGLSRSATITDLNYTNNKAFVKTWYDQSGTGLNLIMNSKASQPLIYDGAIIVDDNNRPSIQFDGWNDALIAQKNINYQNVGSIIAVQSGTASGIETWNNRTVFQSTTIGTNLPSAFNWGAIPRLNNSRMIIRTHGDNTYDSVSMGDINWSGTTGGYFSGTYGGYSNTGNTIIKDSGVNISSFFLIGNASKFSNNFLIDNSTGGYNSIYQGTNGLIVGAYLVGGISRFSKMKVQEILMFNKSYSISKKILLERNIYDYYLPFSVPTSITDVDVKNLTIANKLNNTTSSALNDLVIGLKTNNLWDKMVAIYPITGTLSHYGSSYNLKNISLDSNDWTLSNSGISLSTKGIIYGGGPGGASSIIYKALSDTFTSNNFHMSMYVSGGTLANHHGGVGKGIYAVGNNAITHLSLSPTVKQYNNISVTQSSTTGYFVASSLTQNKLFRNGSLIGTASLSATMSDCYKGTNINGSGGLPRIGIATDQGVAQWTNIQTGFITFGYGLTDDEVSTLSTLVLNYQTALGR